MIEEKFTPKELAKFISENCGMPRNIKVQPVYNPEIGRLDIYTSRAGHRWIWSTYDFDRETLITLAVPFQVG